MVALSSIEQVQPLKLINTNHGSISTPLRSSSQGDFTRRLCTMRTFANSAHGYASLSRRACRLVDEQAWNAKATKSADEECVYCTLVRNYLLYMLWCDPYDAVGVASFRSPFVLARRKARCDKRKYQGHSLAVYPGAA
jgi:hypothetical protein